MQATLERIAPPTAKRCPSAGDRCNQDYCIKNRTCAILRRTKEPHIEAYIRKAERVIKIEMYPEVKEHQLPDEVYEAMTAELCVRIEKFPWKNLSHSVELDGCTLLLTLWEVASDASESDLDEEQATWLDAQVGFVWGVEDKENEEHLSSYRINDLVERC